MGTNYYMHTESGKRHLGKSSAGWKFLLRADPDWPRHQAHTKWIVALAVDINAGGHIEDHYGERVSANDLMELIAAKQGMRSHLDPDPDEEALWRGRNDYGWWKSVQAANFASDGHDFCDREFS